MPTPPIRETPRIESLRVRNYRVLRDVQLKDLTPLTVLIGPNGSGKSTLFDVFAFLAECFAAGLPNAWAHRGGMRELCSRGEEGAITIEVKYRERPRRPKERHPPPLITYHLEICEEDRFPVVAKEWLSWRRKQHGQPFKFLMYQRGQGHAIAGDAPDEQAERTEQPLTAPDLLAVNALGQLQSHPRVAALRSFITGWYLSYLTTPDLRRTRDAGPEHRLSATGENLANVLQHLQRSNPAHLENLFEQLSHRVPQLEKVTADELRDGRLLLQLKDRVFDDPILAKNTSDGTMKLLAYLIVLRDPNPPPLIGIEEPENFVHPRLLTTLAEECLSAAVHTQLLVTTHAPLLLDSLAPEQVRVLARGESGFAEVRSAADILGVKEYLHAGGLLGDAWQQNMFEWHALPANSR